MNRNITALVLAIIAVGIYVTVTQSVLASAGEIKSVNDQYVAAITNAEHLVAVRDQVLAQYNAISDADRARLDKMIPSTVDNIRLIIDLNSVAARRGLSLKGVSASVSDAAAAAPQTAAAAPPAPAAAANLSSQSVSAPTLDTVDVSFGVTATYQQFIGLLQDIEADLRIMDLTHLSVTANDSGLYTFTLQFQTYWIRQTS